MDIRSQLRKYKTQNNELIKLWNDAKLREQNIYRAEMERIAIKTQEFREDCQKEADEIKRIQMEKMEELMAVKAELSKVEAKLCEINGNKFKLRAESLAQIHANNSVQKDLRRTREIFKKQLADINLQISAQQNICNKYEDTRRQINEDFYNWRNECADTRSKLDELQPIDRKYKILSDYLAELELDIRAKPETRYAELDVSRLSAQQQIQQLGYQYDKLEAYLKTIGNKGNPQEIAISSYLLDAGQQIPILKSKQRELQNTINGMAKQIDEYDNQITELGTRDIPELLKEQTARAETRLSISFQRFTNEYEPLIINLNNQIIDLEQQLLMMPSELFGPGSQHNNSLGSNTTTHSILSHSNSASLISNEYPASDQSNNLRLDGNEAPAQLPSCDVANLSQIQPNFVGKSRKEIERIKKELSRQQQIV